KGKNDGNSVGVDHSVRGQCVKPALAELKDDVRECRLANPTERECGQRDSKLYGGEEVVDRVLELEDSAGSGASGGNELLHARLPHADDGELRRDKEAVGQNEEGHHY